MNKINIDQLLEKYWEGESSIDEEKLLRNYFSNEVVHPEHKAFQSLFCFFVQEKKNATKQQSINSEKISFFRRLNFNRFTLGIAASLIVLVVAVIGMRLNTSLNTPANITLIDEDYDMEEAIAITEEALGFLSGKFQNGQSEFTKNMEQVQKINILNFE